MTKPENHTKLSWEYVYRYSSGPIRQGTPLLLPSLWIMIVQKHNSDEYVVYFVPLQQWTLFLVEA